MCYAACPETSVPVVLVKTGHHSELAGLGAPHPWILPGQLPELTHSISCHGALWTLLGQLKHEAHKELEEVSAHYFIGDWNILGEPEESIKCPTSSHGSTYQTIEGGMIDVPQAQFHFTICAGAICERIAKSLLLRAL